MNNPDSNYSGHRAAVASRNESVLLFFARKPTESRVYLIHKPITCVQNNRNLD